MATSTSQMHIRAALARFGIVVLSAASLTIGQTTPGKNTADDVSHLVGNWTGESICQVRPSACHDEKALYKIAKSPDGSTHLVRITACKIVDGREIVMGSSDWNYDPQKGTLQWDGPHGVWKLVVEGKTMRGTLTLPDKTIFRRLTLRKVE